MSARASSTRSARRELERTICATAGIAGVGRDPGRLARGRSRAVAARALRAALGLEPDVDRAAPVEAAAGGARAGARLVVVDPYRSRTARVADEHLAPAARHRRGAGARDDARDPRRRPRRTRSGAAPTPTATTSCWRASTSGPSERCGRAQRRRRPPTSSGSPASSRRTRRRCCGSASARSATPAPRSPTGRSPACPRSSAPGATAAAAAPTSRRRRRPRSTPTAARARRTCGRARRARINMSAARATRSPTRRSTRRSNAFVCWNSNPAAIAPDQEEVLAGLRRDDLFTVVLEQFMTDTAAHADVVLPGDDPARAPRRRLLLGSPLRDLERARDRPARRGEAEHRDLPPARGAAGARRPVLRERPTSSSSSSCSQTRRRASTLDGAARARLGEGRPRPGRDAARRGRLRHRRPASSSCGRTGWPTRASTRCRSSTRPPRSPTRRWRSAIPLALITPKTHLFLNSTFPNQARQHSAQPEPFVVVHPDDAGAARDPRRRARARLQRPRRVQRPGARLRRRPPGRRSWRRWAGGTATTPDGASGAGDDVRSG